MFDGHSQRRPEQFGTGGQVILDDAPVDGVVHVVEQINVGEPHRVFAHLLGILAAAGREVGRPPQPVHVGGALQLVEEASPMREGIPVSRLMLIQNASDSISPPSPPSMRTRISHHRWRCPNTSAAVAARPEIRSGGSGRRWCGAPPRPGAFCRSPGRDRVPASPAQVGAGLRTPQGRERTPVPACKVADSELRRDAGVQVCEVAENASGLDPAAVGGESLSCTRRADRSQLLQVSQYRTRTGLTPASDDMPTTKDHLHEVTSDLLVARKRHRRSTPGCRRAPAGLYQLQDGGPDARKAGYRGIRQVRR